MYLGRCNHCSREFNSKRKQIFCSSNCYYEFNSFSKPVFNKYEPYKMPKSYTNQYKRLIKKAKRAFIKSGERLPIKVLQLIYENNIKKYGTLTCYLCHKPIEFGKDTIDHKNPISRGGRNVYDNIEISCFRCNCRKINKTVSEYFEYLINKEK